MSNTTINSSGVTFPDSSTQASSSGVAKAWVNFVGSSSPTITNSYNVSSVTATSAGFWVVNLTNALTDANFLTFANAYYSTYNGAWSGDVMNGRPISSSSAQISNNAIGVGNRYMGGGNVQAIFYR